MRARATSRLPTREKIGAVLQCPDFLSQRLKEVQESFELGFQHFDALVPLVSRCVGVHAGSEPCVFLGLALAFGILPVALGVFAPALAFLPESFGRRGDFGVDSPLFPFGAHRVAALGGALREQKRALIL